MTWNSSRYTLRKLKRQLKAIRKEDNPVIDKEMSLLEVAAYAGIDVEVLE